MEEIARHPATIALILINIIVSVYAFSNQRFFNENLFWVGPIKHRRQTHRLVTSGFLHVNPPHLIINMYVLFLFGRILEDYLGTKGFLGLYLFSLLGGSAYAYLENQNNVNYRAAGASGAISGLTLAFCMLFPFAQISLFFAIPMYSIVFATLYLGVSYYLSKRPNTLVGHGAHLGGALAGMVIMTLLVPGIWRHLVQSF